MFTKILFIAVLTVVTAQEYHKGDDHGHAYSSQSFVLHQSHGAPEHHESYSQHADGDLGYHQENHHRQYEEQYQGHHEESRQGYYGHQAQHHSHQIEHGQHAETNKGHYEHHEVQHHGHQIQDSGLHVQTNQGYYGHQQLQHHGHQIEHTGQHAESNHDYNGNHEVQHHGHQIQHSGQHAESNQGYYGHHEVQQHGHQEERHGLYAASNLGYYGNQEAHGHHGVSSQNIQLHNDGHETKHVEYYGHPKYDFAYEVKDPHTHDLKYQHESRDGDRVNGVYSLHQPDGTVRVVKYHADKKSGFNADVKYEGHAVHVVPEQKHHHH